jgi:hypothetical protein
MPRRIDSMGIATKFPKTPSSIIRANPTARYLKDLTFMTKPP